MVETSSKSAHTNAAYAGDWKHFARWCRTHGAQALPPSPALIGRYITDCATPGPTTPGLSIQTIERRLSGLAWQYQQRGMTLERRHPQIASVLAHLHDRDARTPVQKQAIAAGDIHAMVATLPHDLRGLRDRAMLLIGFAGGLGRSEIIGLDLGSSTTTDNSGWIDVNATNAFLTLRTKTGLRKIIIAPNANVQACPIHALQTWCDFAKISAGPLFMRTSRDGKRVLATRLNSKHVARLIKQTVIDAGIRADLPLQERLALFSGQSLRRARAADQS